MQTLNSTYQNKTQDARLSILSEKLSTAWKTQLGNSAFANKILAEEVDPKLYLFYMIETYHYTFHNARNQALVGVRARGVSPHYTKFCFEHAEEETGHELMALHDVRSMGYDLSENNLTPPLPETEILVSYLYWVSAFGNPLARLGYSFWAENVYGFIAPQLAKIKSDLKLQNSQMTFFISHSAIDQAHADEVKTVILENCKTAADWEAIERCMLTSLELTLRVTDGILREYKKLTSGESSAYAPVVELTKSASA